MFHAVMNYRLDAAIGEVAERNEGARLRVHFAEQQCLKKEGPSGGPSLVDRIEII